MEKACLSDVAQFSLFSWSHDSQRKGEVLRKFTPPPGTPTDPFKQTRAAHRKRSSSERQRREFQSPAIIWRGLVPPIKSAMCAISLGSTQQSRATVSGG